MTTYVKLSTLLNNNLVKRLKLIQVQYNMQEAVCWL